MRTMGGYFCQGSPHHEYAGQGTRQVKYAPYPAYKPSGVEWLGEVPEHWEVKRLKMAVQLTDKKVEADDENPVPYIGMENIESWTGRLLPISPDVIPTGTANAFKAGHTLFGKLRPYLAKVCNPDFDGLCSTELLVLNGVEFERKALLYALLSDGFIKLVDSSTYGSKMPRANWDFIGNCAMPIAPADEQHAIADFLDAQTLRLDTLVAKKRALIERLKEKRTALISRTVTRGLPPDAARAAGLDPHPKLKPSGIDWLGDVPEHWEVAQLRRFVSFITSGSRGWAEYYADSGSVFVRISNLTRDSIRLDLSDIQYVDPPPGTEGERTRIQTGDLLFSITAYLGSVAVAPPFLLNAYINQHIALVHVHKMQLMPEFAAYATLSDVGQSQLNGQAYGGTKVQLALDDVKSLWLPVPPLSEQHAIADYLDRETAKIDHMVAKVEAAIERLQEYRTALITAAVTGKIDVRGCAADEATSTAVAFAARVTT